MYSVYITSLQTACVKSINSGFIVEHGVCVKNFRDGLNRILLVSLYLYAKLSLGGSSQWSY